MSKTWQDYQRSSRIESTTLVLATNTMDVADPSSPAGPAVDLLDIYQSEKEAALVWHQHRVRDNRWSYGSVRLKYQGMELIDPEYRFDVYFFWSNVVQSLEEFQSVGNGEFYIPETPVMVSLMKIKNKSFLAVGETRVMIDPKSLVSSLVDEAAKFFEWTVRNIGDAAPLREINEIRQKIR